VAGAPVHALLWRGASYSELATLGGGYDVAVSINESDRIVGYAATPKGAQHAVFWHRNKIKDLGTLGGPNSAAAQINNEGNIAGWADTENRVSHAAYWKHARRAPIDLNSEIGAREAALYTLTEAVGINDRCSIVANGYDKRTGTTASFVLSLNDTTECQRQDADDE
jgi:probable HAF family extracellular repeat protein